MKIFNRNITRADFYFYVLYHGTRADVTWNIRDGEPQNKSYAIDFPESSNDAENLIYLLNALSQHEWNTASMFLDKLRNLKEE